MESWEGQKLREMVQEAQLWKSQVIRETNYNIKGELKSVEDIERLYYIYASYGAQRRHAPEMVRAGYEFDMETNDKGRITIDGRSYICSVFVKRLSCNTQ